MSAATGHTIEGVEVTLDGDGLPVVTDGRTSPNHTARAAGVRVETLGVHWSGGGFAGTLDWIGRREWKGERIYASYHALFGARGQVAYPVALERAAYSVGRSRADDPRFGWTTAGNSASENVALAGGPPAPPTAVQRAHLIAWLTARMRAHGWGADDAWRIRGHHQLAWPRGRKPDPVGSGWLDLDAVRRAVAARLLASPTPRAA